MSHKRDKIAAIVDEFQGQDLDAHYLGYFACFNRQLFFEAHEVLEQIWLPQRHGPNGSFYKGLIQLAGAFIHLQKNRPGPAAALFKLAEANLKQYPSPHDRLDLENVLARIANWLRQLESNGLNPLTLSTAPNLLLAPD